MVSRMLLFMVLSLAGSAQAAASSDPLAPSAPVTVTVTAVRPTRAAPASPDVFGTIALAAGVTEYGARWRRVAAADAADPRLVQIAAASAGADRASRVAAIHAEVQRRIAWRPDLETYRISDYWAQAAETLDRGAGDSEDIAVVTMQALKADGIPARDLYLSVGRDSARGADTLLLVRIDDRFYALDDRSSRPIEVRDYKRFVPVITLGHSGAWLHGRRFAGRGGRVHGR